MAFPRGIPVASNVTVLALSRGGGGRSRALVSAPISPVGAPNTRGRTPRDPAPHPVLLLALRARQALKTRPGTLLTVGGLVALAALIWPVNIAHDAWVGTFRVSRIPKPGKGVVKIVISPTKSTQVPGVTALNRDRGPGQGFWGSWRNRSRLTLCSCHGQKRLGVLCDRIWSEVHPVILPSD